MTEEGNIWYFYKDNHICLHCKQKKSVVIGYNTNKVGVSSWCKECFKKTFPNYTLYKTCISCEDYHSCNLQETLFSKSEIQKFRKSINPKTQKIKLLREIS